VAICAGKNVPDFMDVQVTTSYAPIAVVDGLGANNKSFVELDYFTKNCINLLTRPDGVGLIGGITVASEDKADDYLNYVVSRHRELNNEMRVVGKYCGLKNEITFKNQNRNYQYHIVPTEENIWAIVPGKFTLGFSLAVEFYRRVYGRNPKKFFKTVTDTASSPKYVSDTLWCEMVNKTSPLKQTDGRVHVWESASTG
jgi:hypothetical protein